MSELRVKRIYEDRVVEDGYRILTDRLWPRGITKERAALDGWAKEICPSTALRKWFGHKPEHFEDFGEAYRRELEENPRSPAFLQEVKQHLREPSSTAPGMQAVITRSSSGTGRSKS